MAQIERAYATYPTTLVVPLASTHATRCSQHRPPFALVRLLLLRCCCARELCQTLLLGVTTAECATHICCRGVLAGRYYLTVRALLLFVVRATYSPAWAHMMELEEKEVGETELREGKSR